MGSWIAVIGALSGLGGLIGATAAVYMLRSQRAKLDAETDTTRRSINLEEYESIVEAQAADRSYREEQNKTLRGELSELREELRKTQLQVIDLQDEVAMCEADKRFLHAELDKAKSRITQLEMRRDERS